MVQRINMKWKLFWTFLHLQCNFFRQILSTLDKCERKVLPNLTEYCKCRPHSSAHRTAMCTNPFVTNPFWLSRFEAKRWNDEPLPFCFNSGSDTRLPYRATPGLSKLIAKLFSSMCTLNSRNQKSHGFQRYACCLAIIIIIIFLFFAVLAQTADGCFRTTNLIEILARQKQTKSGCQTYLLISNPSMRKHHKSSPPETNEKKNIYNKKKCVFNSMWERRAQVSCAIKP